MIIDRRIHLLGCQVLAVCVLSVTPANEDLICLAYLRCTHSMHSGQSICLSYSQVAYTVYD
ncbi:hypothetical protein NQZ68_014796 [Dissostichus eleginoides]|nr:hypothetical protein NQZ68_014796 [Dissostichus eleginoides]